MIINKLIEEVDFIESYKKFITEDKFISKKDILLFTLKNKDNIEIIKNCIYETSETDSILEIIKKLDVFVDIHNESFIQRKLIEHKLYFDNLFKEIDSNILLDKEQRIAILTEEDYSMIIAGAGSGKTTTMAAKVKYLVDKLSVDPKDIIMISYTNKAIDELKTRINKDFNINVDIKTFHKFGIDILKQLKQEHVKILNNPYPIIAKYFDETIANDNKLLKEFLYFFVYYFDVPTSALEFKSLTEFHQFKKRNDYITLKSRLGDYNKEVINERTGKKYTIKGEFLRSSEEVMIANFLYMNGIDYDYEKPYPYLNKGNLYCPDFTIYQGEKVFYLEHYGITESGKNRYFSKNEIQRYIKGINYKAKIHNDFKTKMITTYSKYSDEKDLLEHLEEELVKLNIIFRKKDDLEIYNKLTDSNKDIYYSRFILFCAEFIKGFKNIGYREEDFKNLVSENKRDKRIVKFLEFLKKLFVYYEENLKIHNYIDFEDMINLAYEELKSNGKKIDLNYKYVIIDEYQDISKQRFNLTKLISEVTNSKIVAVGDDFQAIFAFAGSDVKLFTEFKTLMGYGEEMLITTTYRNSQELINLAGSFVMKNKMQIKKKLKSDKKIDKPVIINFYDNSTEMKSNKLNAINKALEEINNENVRKNKVLIVGRYSFDKIILLESDLFYEYGNSKIKSKDYPNLDITFLTVHSAKGLGFDNVILINNESGLYGFPSNIKDDPIMELIQVKDDSYIYAEERRLFYVALTRTKNKVYLIAPINNYSIFIKEILNSKNVQKIQINDKIKVNKKMCPICSFPLILKENKFLNIHNLYECSNEKEICNFKTNNLNYKRNITKCKKCKIGYEIVKYSKKRNSYFLGCTNYKENKSGCNYIRGI